MKLAVQVGRGEAVAMICAKYKFSDLDVELPYACRHWNTQMVKDLLSSLSWENPVPGTIEPALKNALKRGHTEISEALLASIPRHLNFKSFTDCLYLALKKNLWTPAQVLLDLGNFCCMGQLTCTFQEFHLHMNWKKGAQLLISCFSKGTPNGTLRP